MSRPATINFLDLPKEMRLRIYDYLVRPSCITIASTWRRKMDMKPGDAEVLPQFFARSSADVCIDLLCTRKQIYDEACDLVLQPHRLRLQPTRYYESNALEGWATIDLELLQHMPDIHTLEIDIRMFSVTLEQDLDHGAFLTACLPPLARVQRLDVTVVTNLCELRDQDILRIISLWQNKVSAMTTSLKIKMNTSGRGDFDLIKVLARRSHIWSRQSDGEEHKGLDLASLWTMRVLERAMVRAFIDRHIDLGLVTKV